MTTRINAFEILLPLLTMPSAFLVFPALIFQIWLKGPPLQEAFPDPSKGTCPRALGLLCLPHVVL